MHRANANAASFDDHPAAVNTVLALWAGLVGGVVVAIGGFDDPRPAYNACVRLMTLGATAVALGWALQTSHLALARRLQLGVAASLILHTLLAVGLSQSELFTAADSIEARKPPPRPDLSRPLEPQVVVVDRRTPDARPAFDRPVASGKPQLQAESPEPERAAPRVAEAPGPLAEAPTDKPRLAALLPEMTRPRTAAARLAMDRGEWEWEQGGAAAAAVATRVEPVVDPDALPVDSGTPPASQPRLPEPARTRSRGLPTIDLDRIAAPAIDPAILTPRPPQRLADRPDPAPAALTPSPRGARRLAVVVALPNTVETPAARSDVPAARSTPVATSPRPGRFAGRGRPRSAARDRRASEQLPRFVEPGAASQSAASQLRLGLAESPRRRAERPQSAAAELTPRSTTRANTAVAADFAGAAEPDTRNATSGAARDTRFADAPLADTTAAAGPQAMDLAAPDPVADRGPGWGESSPGRRELEEAAGSRRTIRPGLVGPSALALPAPMAADTGGRVAVTNLSPAARPRRALIGPIASLGGGRRQPRHSGSAPPRLAPTLPSTETRPSAAESTAAGTTGQPLRLAMGRRASGVAPPRLEPPTGVALPAERGVGGLATASSKALGLPEGLLPDAAVTRNRTGRAPRPRPGGAGAIAGEDRRPAAAYNNRGRRLEEKPSGGAGRPTPKSEAAIELGLRFLSSAQREDGRWSFAELGGLEVSREETPNVRADAAATGLALLSMLGAGYDHFGGEHQRSIADGLAFLVSTQKPSGELFPEDRPPAAGAPAPWQVARFYSHGIATIALCEAYGMTGDAKLRGPAQRALDYIAKQQVDRLGGWRYTPGVNSDLSVTGWQMMALKSGQLAGLSVDPAVYQGVAGFVERCRERTGDRARFCYNPTAPASDPRTRHGLKPGTVMTSVGVLMRLYLGDPPAGEPIKRGADHLLANLPTVGEGPLPAATSTLENPLRDTYYWYYATQVMFHMGGDYWRDWNDALRPMLLETQTKTGPLAGSWNPLRPTPDKWAPFGGRLYVTAMNLLSLEVRYRHLPLYAEVAPRPAETQ